MRRRSRSDPLSPTLPRQGGGSKRISGLRYRSQRSQQGGLNAYASSGLSALIPSGHDGLTTHSVPNVDEGMIEARL